MPSIRKKNTVYLNTLDLSDDEETAMETDLKENFKLEDFLACDETREILEQNWLYTFNKKCEKEIWDFYENECDEKHACFSSLLYYDTEGYGSFAGKLSAIIFNHIQPEYDLEYFYNYPYLAKPLIEHRNNKKKRDEEEHKRLVHENYEKNSKNKGKIFNWATKTYKK